MNSRLIIINEKDIENSVTNEDLICGIEHAYRIQDSESTYVPDRSHLDYKGNTLLLMPGFTSDVFGTKLVTLFPENYKKQLSVLSGIMVLNDIETGYPKAIIHGAKLTAVRTGAVGATAVKYMAPEDSEILGIIGAGIQAYHQAVISINQRDFKSILISDKDAAAARAMKEKLIKDTAQDLSIEIIRSDELVQESDVIITATSSVVPVFDTKLRSDHKKCIIGIGSYKPNMQEIPIVTGREFDKIFVDTPFAKEESGDIKIPMDNGLLKDEAIHSFSSLVTNQESINKKGINFFKSVGMSLFDLTVGEMIYKKVIEKGVGQSFTF